MSKEAEMKEVELNELEQEKQSMNADTEKNGCVKVKVPEDSELKFTGLSKEELMRVAGTPGWVRTRWILLVLFWIGWVGMLAGAVVIIVQAPRCKPIPEMNWWNEGPLYKISNLKKWFSTTSFKEIEEKLDNLNQLKVKGLILGPVHTVQENNFNTLELMNVNPEIGTGTELHSLIEKAHKKGMSIVLDLTPNYEGNTAWFNPMPDAIAEKLTAACSSWLEKGVDGFFFTELSQNLSRHKAWRSIQDVVQSNVTEQTKKMALMGSVTGQDLESVFKLLNTSGVNLAVTQPPEFSKSKDIAVPNNTEVQSKLAWNSVQDKSPLPIRLQQILLFTLPGTPVFKMGDEVGLKEGEPHSAIWDLDSPAEENNQTAKDIRAERNAVRSFFRVLSDLRGKERALLHGEYVSLYNSNSALAFLRLWDQSERFITAINSGDTEITMALSHTDLPKEAQVRVSTDKEKLAIDSKVSLDKLQLGPKTAVLLSYLYTG